MSAVPEAVRATGAARGDAVWVVDDDRSIRWVLEKALARRASGTALIGTPPRGRTTAAAR